MHPTRCASRARAARFALCCSSSLPAALVCATATGRYWISGIEDGSPDQASFTKSGDAWCTAMPHHCRAKLTLTFLVPVAGPHHGRKQHGPRCDGPRGHLRTPGAPSSCRIGSESCVTVMYHGSILAAAVEQQMKLYFTSDLMYCPIRFRCTPLTRCSSRQPTLPTSPRQSLPVSFCTAALCKPAQC